MKDPIIEARREFLVGEIERLLEMSADRRSSSSPLRRLLDSLYEQLVALDSLASQARLVEAQHQVASAQRESAEAQRQATTQAERDRRGRENRAFWSRRFLTYLAVAHGAGAFAAITSLLRSPPPVASNYQVFGVISCFGMGLVVAGTIPMIITAYGGVNHERYQAARVSVWLAIASSIALIAGIVLTTQVALTTFDHNRLDRNEPAAGADPLARGIHVDESAPAEPGTSLPPRF